MQLILRGALRDGGLSMVEMRQRCHPLGFNISVPIPGLSTQNLSQPVPLDRSDWEGICSKWPGAVGHK